MVVGPDLPPVRPGGAVKAKMSSRASSSNWAASENARSTARPRWCEGAKTSSASACSKIERTAAATKPSRIFGDARQHLASEAGTTSLPRRAQHRGGEVVRGHQLHSSETARLEAAQERHHPAPFSAVMTVTSLP